MRKRFLAAMLLALGISLFGGLGQCAGQQCAGAYPSMLHVCWLKDSHVNPAACEVVRMPDAFESGEGLW